MQHRFVKPHVDLPVSLHDARVTSMRVTRGEGGGTVVFHFGGGIKRVERTDAAQTGAASVTLTGIDYDFSRVYYCKGDSRRGVAFETLARDIGRFSFDIMDESYGYNLTKLSAHMVAADSWHEVDIEIYHHGDTLYEWEDAAPR